MTEKLYVGYRVTERCNAGPQCISRCFSRQGLPQEDPSLSTIQDVFRRIAPFVHTINIMGGEPPLRSDIPQVLQMAQQEGMQCVLSTNGILLHPEKYPGRLEKIIPHLNWMSLSLDSANPDKNDWMRGTGQYNAAKAIIRWFYDNRPDCELKINTQVTRENIREITDIPHIFGFDVVTDWKLLQWTGRGDARRVTNTWSISPEQFSWVVSTMRTTHPQVITVERAWPEPEPDTILIRPDGTLQINGPVDDYFPVGNILTEDPSVLFERSRTLYGHLSDANRTEYHESYPSL